MYYAYGSMQAIPTYRVYRLYDKEEKERVGGILGCGGGGARL